MNYRVITDYERYKIYDNGTVYSDVSRKFLNPIETGANRKKYLAVQLCNQNGMKKMKIHKLVAEYFIEKPDGENLIIDHINHDKFNNNVYNLRYVTHGENHINRDNKHNKHGHTGIYFQPLKVVDGKTKKYPAYRVQIKTPDGQSIRKYFYTGKNPTALNDAINYRKQLEEQYYPNIKIVQ